MYEIARKFPAFNSIFYLTTRNDVHDGEEEKVDKSDNLRSLLRIYLHRVSLLFLKIPFEDDEL